MTQPQETDFASYARLSESEQKVIEEALAALPDDILSTGERPPIEARIRNHLKREGLLSDAPLGMGEIPPVAYVGRAVGCLAASYATLRSISHAKNPKYVADAIAGTIGTCVSGSKEAIAADILTYRSQVARAVTAIGLPALGDALLADDKAT